MHSEQYQTMTTIENAEKRRNGANMNFNVEEMNLIAAFDTGNRADTVEQMMEMRSLLDRTIAHLNRMTDEEYDSLEIITDDGEEDNALD